MIVDLEQDHVVEVSQIRHPERSHFRSHCCFGSSLLCFQESLARGPMTEWVSLAVMFAVGSCLSSFS